jgi:hypothetical protein
MEKRNQLTGMTTGPVTIPVTVAQPGRDGVRRIEATTSFGKAWRRPLRNSP